MYISTSVRVSRRTVPSRKRARLTATVRRGSKRLAGARVVIRARHLRKVVRTDRRGRARFAVRAKRAQKRLTIRVAARKRAACTTPVAYVRVRRARSRPVEAS